MFLRLTKAVFIKVKQPSTITGKALLIWIREGLGTSKKFLANNGGEFTNLHYVGMCKKSEHRIYSTVAESPWQNGICE